MRSQRPPPYAGWYNCTLASCGALASFYFIFAANNDAAWTGNRVFLIDASNPANKAVLAAALTGYSTTGQVSLYLPDSIAENTFVQGVVAGSL